MVQLGFDPNQYEVPTFGDPIKPGWYSVVLASCTLEATKDAKGSYLEITYEVDKNAHPDEGGRKLWDRLNIHNNNEKAQKIARGVMRKLQECCGKPVIQDTDELIGCSVLAKVVTIEARKGTDGTEYPAKNEIKDYKPIGATVPATTSAPAVGASAASAPASTAAPAAAATVPSWMKKPGT